jgi:hypothetical protein
VANAGNDFLRRYREIKTWLRGRHQHIYLIVAPPRSSSTALARVFWRHPAIGFYNNEPFDRYYHWGSGLDSVLDHLQNSNFRVPGARGGQGLLIKEMTFQVDTHFGLLAELATSPTIFVLRDPRLSIASRMRMVAEAGGDPLFPHNETGWPTLYRQVQDCRSQNRPYILVNADDFRRDPVPVLPRLFASSSLSFSSEQLRWQPAPAMRLGNLDGEQDNFYAGVLNSQGLEPPTEPPPPLKRFPARSGLRAHVQWCMTIYRELLADPHLITAAATATPAPEEEPTGRATRAPAAPD